MADAAAYRALRLEALAGHPASFGASHEEEAGQPLAWFADRMERGAVFGGWDVHGQLAGTAGLWIPTSAKSRHQGALWGMFVRREDRGTGLAAALLDQVIAYARGRVEDIVLDVVAGNDAAIRLYHRAGFRQYGLEPRSLKVDGRYHDAVLMILSVGV